MKNRMNSKKEEPVVMTILNWKFLLKNTENFNIKTHPSFAHFKKAFDGIKRRKWLEILDNDSSK
jgi:hypothetical protein